MGGGSWFEALNAEEIGINGGEDDDGSNHERFRINLKQGEKPWELKGKSKAQSGSDTLNVGIKERNCDTMNSDRYLYKLYKPRRT